MPAGAGHELAAAGEVLGAEIHLGEQRGLALGGNGLGGVGLAADDWPRADDLAAVVDALGTRDIVLVTWDGFGVGSRYAAMHPERVSALVLYEPVVVEDDEWESWSARRIQRSKANMRGEDDILVEVAPSRIADRGFRDWYARAGRLGAAARRHHRSTPQ